MPATNEASNEELFRFFVSEANYPFSGWDFSHITRTGRMAEEPLPWSYASKIFAWSSKAQSLLDLGTGGGEFLSSLQPLPSHTAATEGYAPNRGRVAGSASPHTGRRIY